MNIDIKFNCNRPLLSTPPHKFAIEILKQKNHIINHLWKVTAKRDSGNIAKGMSVEIIVKNATIGQLDYRSYQPEVWCKDCFQWYHNVNF